MASLVHLTILFEETDDGWIVATVPQVPGAHSQGRTRGEARENVLDALNGLLEMRAETHVRAGRSLATESLELTVAV